MLSGLFILGVCLICFGMLDLLTNSTLISVLAIILRFVEGFASGSINTANYSIASNEYPEEAD